MEPKETPVPVELTEPQALREIQELPKRPALQAREDHEVLHKIVELAEHPMLTLEQVEPLPFLKHQEQGEQGELLEHQGLKALQELKELPVHQERAMTQELLQPLE